MKPTKKQRLFLCLLFLVTVLLKDGSGLSKDKDNIISISAIEEPKKDLEGQKSKSQYLKSDIIDEKDDNTDNEEHVEQDQEYAIDKNEGILSQEEMDTETQQVPIDLTQENQQNNTISASIKSKGDEVEEEIQQKQPTAPAVKSKTKQQLLSQKMTKLMNMMHAQAEGFKQQSQNYYSKLTTHLGGQINIFIGILGIILAFSILFIAVKGFSSDFPFLRGLSRIIYSKKRSNYGFITSPNSEGFYTGYNFTNSNSPSSRSINHQTKYAYENYLQADRNLNCRDQRQQKDYLKDPVSPSEYLLKNNHINRQDFRNKGQYNMDDTFIENENDFLIKDLLDFQEHQSLETSNQDIDLEVNNHPSK